MALLRLLSRRPYFYFVVQEKVRLNRFVPLHIAYMHAQKEDEIDKPIPFSKSKAATWKAQATRSGESAVDYPWYQSYVISASLTIFMLYFCVFREENDIDEELGRSLYDRIEGLEERQLQLSLDYNEQHGKDTSAILARLEQLQKEKNSG
ncbi:uncharacterized protein [Periplaneta americana]|uniref:uncharacterized protein n=1 Tax=Periplaneta americana TaxID=6978 RepID=UPI0037E70434